MRYNVEKRNNFIEFSAYNKKGKVWDVKYTEHEDTLSRLNVLMFVCNEFQFTKSQALRAIKCALYEGYKVKENEKEMTYTLGDATLLATDVILNPKKYKRTKEETK